jgi:hypothetical protein
VAATAVSPLLSIALFASLTIRIAWDQKKNRIFSSGGV